MTSEAANCGGGRRWLLRRGPKAGPSLGPACLCGLACCPPPRALPRPLGPVGTASFLVPLPARCQPGPGSGFVWHRGVFLSRVSGPFSWAGTSPGDVQGLPLPASPSSPCPWLPRPDAPSPEAPQPLPSLAAARVSGCLPALTSLQYLRRLLQGPYPSRHWGLTVSPRQSQSLPPRGSAMSSSAGQVPVGQEGPRAGAGTGRRHTGRCRDWPEMPAPGGVSSQQATDEPHTVSASPWHLPFLGLLFVN